MQLVVLGLNHRTAPLETRERAALLPDEATEVTASLLEDAAAAEVVILSTCNRTEFYTITNDPAGVIERQREMMRQRKSVDLTPGDSGYLYQHDEAVRHLFRVAAGVDSMVLGENGIVAQVKNAFEAANNAGAVGPLLGKLFPCALRVAKRARTETEIGHGAVSLPNAGLTLARKVFGALDTRHALVIGAGTTGTALAERLKEIGVRSITVANRTRSRAEEVAERVGGKGVGLEDLPDVLAECDVVLSAVHSATPVLTRDTVARAMEPRKFGRPLLAVDLGVPRNIDPGCGSLEGVFLYAVDDLQQLVNLNLGRRRLEIPAVEKIVDEECGKYTEWRSALDATPVLVALRAHVEALRQESLERFGGSIPDSERERLDQFSRALVNKLLHAPTLSVKGCDSSTAQGLAQLDWTRRLFAVDGESRDGDES